MARQYTRHGNAFSICTLVHKAQIRWAGHVQRVPSNRNPKQLLYGELLHGRRSVGGQKKRFEDILKASLKAWASEGFFPGRGH